MVVTGLFNPQSVIRLRNSRNWKTNYKKVRNQETKSHHVCLQGKRREARTGSKQCDSKRQPSTSWGYHKNKRDEDAHSI